LQTAREPAKGTLIDVVPETARDLPDQFGVAGAGGGAGTGPEEFDIATGVYESRIAPAESCVPCGDREPELSTLDLFAGIGVNV
jgi:hypothetical protein